MKKVKLTVKQFTEICNYVTLCFETELFFEGKMFAQLIEFHLQEIQEKLHRKALDIQYKKLNKVVLKLSVAEQICFSVMLAKVPCSDYMLAIEHKLIEGL